MSLTIVRPDLEVALDSLAESIEEVLTADLGQLSAAEELALVGRLEQLRRRLDAGTDRAADHLDRSAAFSHDGHRSAKAALKAIGRLPGSEALGRVRTARALRVLPLVEAAYRAGDIPVAHARLIGTVAANPRMAQHLPGADPIFRDAATTLGYDDFAAAIREWERLADADGADQSADETHERRKASLHRSQINGSYSLDGSFGAAQGSVIEEIWDRYERAELLADWAAARALHGTETRHEHLDRTPAQRRADALYAIFVRAASTPADAHTPAPLVNIVIDQRCFDEQLRRAAGEEVSVDPNDDLPSRRCHSLNGTPLHPGDVLAAALVGHVRRVVVDAAGTVIDLGRKRRLFTGSARDAALLQALLRTPGGLRCLWPGCDARGGNLQIDHREPVRRDGPTDVSNSDAYCGFHNRTKEHGFRPERRADGTWVIHRPHGGGPITPSV
ncbi:MAG TPA: DUF222 domain-containing protein [Acidimicrobiales bacterium]|nr:DUF222 domain-containing protein [Acidimicrobiales bacterium]